jgi:hypothetical protein
MRRGGGGVGRAACYRPATYRDQNNLLFLLNQIELERAELNNQYSELVVSNCKSATRKAWNENDSLNHKSAATEYMDTIRIKIGPEYKRCVFAIIMMPF